jgi:hypothetical protein
VSSDPTSPSDENHRSGLWLWHGKAPLPPSALQPASRVQQIPDPNVSALRWRGWMVLPGGVALALLAVMLHSTPPDMPAPAGSAAVALEPVPSPTNASAVIPAPPVNISAPRVEHTDTQLDQAHPAPLSPARGTEHQPAKKAAHQTSARTVRKNHASADRDSPLWIHGVLAPPEPRAWHGGGY